MAIEKNAIQILDTQVEDWEASSKPQSFQVPPGTYICDLESASVEVFKPKDGGAPGAMGVLLFISKRPLEGRQLRVTRFLTSTNNNGEHYGIGQLCDELDVLFANLGEKPVNRKALHKGKGKALVDLLASLADMNARDIPVVADTPGRSKAGKSFQNLRIGLKGSTDGDGGVSTSNVPAVGDEIDYAGKTWRVAEVDDVGVTLKRGRASKIVSFDELNGAAD